MILEDNQIKELLEKIKDLEIRNSTKSNYSIDDKRVPRVTEILSAMMHEDNLMNWANGLGWKRISYRAFMKDAQDKGTYSHLAIEIFLRQGRIDLDTDLQIPNQKIRDTVESCLDGFIQWWNELHKLHKNIKLIYLEETMINEYFGGTCDCLLQVDGEYWLLDFKTSNHMNYKYSLQLAAYRYLLKNTKNINISKCMILRLDKLNHFYETQEFNLSNKDHLNYIENCEQTFMILLTAFKMRMYTNLQYQEITNLNKK